MEKTLKDKKIQLIFVGDMYQVSNKQTLGISEKEIIQKI